MVRAVHTMLTQPRDRRQMTSFRLPASIRQSIQQLARKRRITATAVVELAVNRLAEEK